MSQNQWTQMTLDVAVKEVLGLLTGMDLTYEPELDRYNAVTRQLNRALRLIALEREWSYYSSVVSVGTSATGDNTIQLPSSIRPRMIMDDAVRLVDAHGHAFRWAPFLQRDAIHKYPMRSGLWCSVTNNVLTFSRQFTAAESGYQIMVPVMREPTMFVLPVQPEDSDEPLTEVPTAVRNQLVDFVYPDLVTLKAAYLYAQTDPLYQPRVQTIEAQYKDLSYQIIERDERNTDSPFQNEWFVPVQNGIYGSGAPAHWHPHADERR